MKKPKIRVYKNGDQYIYKNDLANELHMKYYGGSTIYLKAIFFILGMVFRLEKDENGHYLNKTEYDKQPNKYSCYS